MRKTKKRKPDFRRIRPSKAYLLPEIIARAERQKNTLRKLAQRVEERIAERKAKRKSPPQK